MWYPCKYPCNTEMILKIDISHENESIMKEN